MHTSLPFHQEIVFVGGGHTHALVLRSLGMRPIAGARVTLVSEVTHTPYSGMLPGFLTDVYSFDDSHIDLRRLCEFAGARFVLQQVTGLELADRRVLLADHVPIFYDLLSINVGSTPDTKSVPGAAEFAVPVKPVPEYLAGWAKLKKQIEEGQRPSVVFVGGGAGGVELALAYRSRLGAGVEIHLVHQNQRLLNTHSPKVSRVLAEVCRQRDIKLHLADEVTQVTPEGVECGSGRSISSDHVVWITGASAPTWLAEAGLAVDEGGFVRVGRTLQSESHPEVFAVGDIATIMDHQRPKSGVFAVRAAKPLVENLHRHCAERPLLNFEPQKKFLGLINTGDGTAVASRGSFVLHNSLMWKWKDRIDQKFMRLFSDLRPMSGGEIVQETVSSDVSTLQEIQLQSQMRCMGCAAKVGRSTLERVLERLQAEFPDVVDNDEMQVGIGSPDDAAVLAVPDERLLVQSIDYLSAVVSDSYLLGRIIANHGFSDIFAMGALPHSATALLLVPFAAAHLMEQDAYQCLAGVATELRAMKATLLGGHTAEGSQLGVALHCNGFAEPDRLLRKQGVQVGDRLILTKPLGIGTLFAAQMRLAAKGRWIDGAIESMLVSNQRAGECFQQFGATACTDVTGFGLWGHLDEMVGNTDVSVELFLEEPAVLEGALETAESGLLSSLDPQNRQQFFKYYSKSGCLNSPRFDLLFDPQTSGGLLASVPDERAEACLKELHGLGYGSSAIIGVASDRKAGISPIVLRDEKLQ